MTISAVLATVWVDQTLAVEGLLVAETVWTVLPVLIALVVCVWAILRALTGFYFSKLTVAKIAMKKNKHE